MNDLLTRLLAERDWLLADGATGTNLFDMGLAHGLAPELWNLEEPDKVRAHYRAYIEVGSDIILANTFGGTANRLKLHGAADQVHGLNKAAVALLREEIDKAGRAIVCAASVGPTGDLFVPSGPLTLEQGRDAYVEQMQGLKDGGADVLWIETMYQELEIEAALAAARVVGLPTVCTLSFDTSGRTMMGTSPTDMVRFLRTQMPRPVAFGGNCGTGAPDLLAGLLSAQKAITPDDILVAKANCGIPQVLGDSVVYSGTPELMADYARLARDIGVRIIGGCCGTRPTHVEAMRAALEAHTPGKRPTLETIVARLGPLTGATQTLFDDKPAAAPRRRRRSRKPQAGSRKT